MPRFVIHKHAASHLHYDFRLELDGALKSWAVPKEPPRESGIKRLAVQVEDHPLSYADFHGIIEEGYGKGTVKIWDSGKFELLDRKPEKIVFKLKGRKMKGEYVLVRFKTNKEKNANKNWLLFKK
jgi:DNA ligase D-like protein (predicted 3'-phosphoesterase)